MAFLLRAAIASCDTPDMAEWRYEISGKIECASWAGGVFPDLKMHFHRDAQLSVVTGGERSFSTPSGIFHVATAEAILFPPGLPHKPLAGSGSFSCENFYFPANAMMLPRCAIVIGAEHGFLEAVHVPDAIQALLEAFLDHDRDADPQRAPLATEASDIRPIITVGQLAQDAGISREHYSRRFKERYGMPPGAFLLNQRLNQARDLLRYGMSPAEAAYVTGFSDQSHLNRHFKARFGIPPGRYRTGTVIGNLL